MSLRVLSVSPAASVQDQGRPGHLNEGLSRGGAIDIEALTEGAALLGHPPQLAAVELPGFGGSFEASSDLRIALTGAPMAARAGDRRLIWNAAHNMAVGERFDIGAPTNGTFGYLHVSGGIISESFLGSRAFHGTAGLGTAVAAGETLAIGGGTGQSGVRISAENRFEGGIVRVLPSVQTQEFSQDVIDRFTATRFRKSAKSNRMAARLDFDGEGFSTNAGLSILSEVVVPGDIQITGEGHPAVLMPDCQTTGGYPRIATVLPCDFAIVAQASPGTEFNFRFVELEEALAAHRTWIDRLASLPGKVEPLIRDPASMADLLSHQLIGGVISAREP